MHVLFHNQQVATSSCVVAIGLSQGRALDSNSSPLCRSALISLSDLTDDGMRDAKSGEWWQRAPWRYMANISAVYDARPSRQDFDAEWSALVASGSGERGARLRSYSRSSYDALQVQLLADNAGHGINACTCFSPHRQWADHSPPGSSADPHMLLLAAPSLSLSARCLLSVGAVRYHVQIVMLCLHFWNP